MALPRGLMSLFLNIGNPCPNLKLGPSQCSESKPLIMSWTCWLLLWCHFCFSFWSAAPEQRWGGRSRHNSVASLGPPHDSHQATVGICSARCEKTEVNIYYMFVVTKNKFPFLRIAFLLPHFYSWVPLCFLAHDGLASTNWSSGAQEKNSLLLPKAIVKEGGRKHISRVPAPCWGYTFVPPPEVTWCPSSQRGVWGLEGERLVLWDFWCFVCCQVQRGGGRNRSQI